MSELFCFAILASNVGLFSAAQQADDRKPPLSLRRPVPHLHGSWRGIGFRESGGDSYVRTFVGKDSDHEVDCSSVNSVQ